MTPDDIKSEIYYCVAIVNDRIENRLVKFDWGDSEQVLKYFRYTVRSAMCRKIKKLTTELFYYSDGELKKYRDNPLIDFSSLCGYEIDFPCETVNSPTPREIIKGLTQKKIYNYVMRLYKKNTEKSLIADKVILKFGKRGVSLLLNLKYLYVKKSPRIENRGLYAGTDNLNNK